MKKKLLKIAFLDRDGALIWEPLTDHQIDSLEKLRILDGVIEALQELQWRNYCLALITNQDGLGTTSFPRETFEAPQRKMLQIFKKNGIEFEEILICPHFPKDQCLCRKPKLGLVKYFLENNQIDLQGSFVYGDRESDEKFAKNLGIKFIKTETNTSAAPLYSFIQQL